MKQFVALGLSLLLLTSCEGEKNETPPTSARYVKTYQVSNTGKSKHRIFPGKALASQTADMSFQVPGELIEFPIKEGEDVEQGQLLARLDPTNFELDVRKLQALRDNAKVELERSAVLLKKDFTSKSSYDLKAAELEVAESNLATAKERLKDTALLAPFSGKIGKTYVENFQQIQAKTPILTLHQVNPIDVSVQLPEDVAAQIKQGNVVDHYVAFSVIPNQRFSATYKESSSIADPVTQTYDVVMTLPNPEGVNILPGMTANVGLAFEVGESDQGVFVPISAIAAEADGSSYVYVINPQSQALEKRVVSLAPPTGDQVEIIKGLQDGETIIIAGVNFLREGEKVQSLPEEFQP